MSVIELLCCVYIMRFDYNILRDVTEIHFSAIVTSKKYSKLK